MTTVMIKRALAGLLAALSLGSVLPVQAVGQPEVSLTVTRLPDSDIRDGTVLARGRVINREAHTGFQLWLDAPRSGEAPDRWVLSGKNNPSHQMRVRPRLTGSVPDSRHGRGVILHTPDLQVSFEIVADGRQKVAPDEYVLTVRADDPAAD